MKKQKENKKGLCRGSFILGTACANCERCKLNHFTKENKVEKIEAEKERTKDFPADRVKKKKAVYIVDK